jgi:hypothetical protein
VTEKLELTARSVRLTERRKAARLGWPAYALTFVPGLLGTSWLVLGGTLPHGYFRFVGVLMMVGLSTLVLALQYIMRGAEPGKVVVESQALSLVLRGGIRRFDQQQFVSGIAIEQGGGGLVEFVTASGMTIEIELESVEAAHALLAATGVESDARVTIVRLGSRYPASLVITATAAIALLSALVLARRVSALLGSTAGGMLVVAGVLGASVIAGWLWSGTDVVVGRDGVRLRHLFTRFIPYDDVRHVDIIANDGRVRITLGDGSVVKVHPIPTEHPQRMKALLHYIHRAMILEEGPSAAALHVLDRRNETVSDWRNRLKHLLVAQPGYRGAKISAGDALAIVADAGRKPVHRIGAALALADGGALDDDARNRLRSAAEGSANPKLRIALEALAEGEIEEAAIEEAATSVVTKRR